MSAFRHRLRLPALLLLFLLGATPVTGLSSEVGAQTVVEAVDSASGALANPADPSGTGVWERAGCVVCAAAFLAAAGTTILGVAITAIAFPELAAACGLTCAYAYG